jgi:hypothetical protein
LRIFDGIRVSRKRILRLMRQHTCSRPTVRAFAARYNAEWLIEKNGCRSPLDRRADWIAATVRRAA